MSNVNNGLHSWIRSWFASTVTKIRKSLVLMLVLSILGSVSGLLYSWLKPVRYISQVTFYVEESKNLGGGLLSSLGGQLGIDLGSLSGGGNSVISGDNMLQLLRSTSFLKTCLKTTYANDPKYCLADRYADVYGLRKKWAKSSKVGKQIFFGVIEKNHRLQDSLLNVISECIAEKELSIAKPDKKLSFFSITVNTKDERLSQLITARLLTIATDFYVDAKVGRLKNNVERLEKRTDSMYRLLNRRTYEAKSDATLLLNVNPAYVSAPATSEISQRDKMVMTTIYGELMKNLEVSKVALAQETPTIQITDQSDLPLKRDEVKWYEGMAVGAALPVIAVVLVLIL